MKRFISILLTIAMSLTVIPQSVMAAVNIHYTDFSVAAPSGWTLNGATAEEGTLQIPPDSSKTHILKLSKPYPSGTVVVEYDFKSNGQRGAVFIQSPKGGSVCRLLLNSTTTLQFQHSNDAGTANETTTITKEFKSGEWYHMRHIVRYKTGEGEKAETDVYIYDMDGNLKWSVLNKCYMDASRFATPTDLQVIILQNPGGAGTGNIYFDNFAVFEQTEEAVIEINKKAVAIDNADSIREDIALKTSGIGGAKISWKSSDTSVVSDDGKVSEVYEETKVTMTATISYGNSTATVTIPITVLPEDDSVVKGEVYAWDFNDNVLPAGFNPNKKTEGFNGIRNGRIEVTKPDGTTVTSNPQITLNFNNMNYGAFGGKVIAEFDYSSTSTSGPIAYFQATPNSGSVARIEQTKANVIKVTTGGTGETPVNTGISDSTFEQGKEYHAKVILDYNAQKCSVYIDDTAVAENHNFMNSTSPGALNTVFILNTGTSGTIAVDNFVLYNEGADEAVLVTEKMLDIEGKNGITEDIMLPTTGYNGAAIEWKSQNPEIISDSGALLKVPTVDTKVTLTATITKGVKVLEKNIEVKVTGVPDYSTVTFSKPAVSVNEDGDEVVTVTVTKPRKEVVSFTLVAAAFDDENKLISVSFGDETIGVDKASGKLTIPQPKIYDASKGTYEYYIWDNFENMMPLTEDTSVDFLTDAEMTIACWGDSLTIGQGSTNAFTTNENSYPAVLAELTGETVYNMGVGGETSMTIAARQGAVDMIFTEDFTIPQSGSVNIPLAYVEENGEKHYYIATADDGKVVPRDINRGMWNPVTINGVEGTLSVDVDTDLAMRMLSGATFTRKESGEAVEVKAGDKLKTGAQDIRADVNIFFTGTNGGWNENNTKPADTESDAADLIELIKKQIAATKDSNKYIVIGLTNGSKNKWAVTNPALKEAFGERFLDAKAYLATEQALADAGITPTEQDKADIASGTVPTSLRVDTAHFNDAGYRLLANLVYDKLNELEYLWMSEICEVKDNKKAIWTFTSDDSLTDSCNYFSEKFNELGLRGSLAMIVKKFYYYDTVLDDKVNTFKNILSYGNFDITNHSYSHTSPLVNPDDKEYWTAEINNAQEWFENTFPGERVFTVANPLVATSDTIDEIIKEKNWAARNGKGGGYNSLNPTEDEWFHLRWMHGNEYCTVDSMKAWVDNAINNRQWQLELWHGVDGEGSSPVKSEIATPYFEYVASKKGELWVATFNEAVQYLREKQHAVMETEAKNGKIEVTITHDLPMDIFNYPLSVRTRVPGDWDTALVTQNGKTQAVEVKGRHIVYDVVPDGSTAIVEKMN